jgi:uncharacterized membrane protein YhaH (DUF805 family)
VVSDTNTERVSGATECRNLRGETVKKFGDIFLLWRGRVSRKTYWLCGLLPASIIPVTGAVLCSPAAVTSGICSRLDLPVWLRLLALLAALYIGLMLSVKRSHDLGYTGLFSLVLLVPPLSLWPLILFAFFKGTEGENKYGPPDRRFPHVFVNE